MSLAEPPPVQHQRRVVHGGGAHRHRHVPETPYHLAPMPQPHQLVQPFDGLILGLEPGVPVAPRVFVEGGLGEIASQAVVDLPGDEPGMLAQRLGHFLHDQLRALPVHVAVQAGGPPRPLVLDQPLLIDGQHLRILARQPDRRGGRRRRQHQTYPLLPQEIHRPLQPAKIEPPLLRLAQTPDEFAHADDVDASLDHVLGIGFPGCLGVLGRPCVGVDPLFRMVVNAEIHIRPFACGFSLTLGTFRPFRNAKVAVTPSRRYGKAPAEPEPGCDQRFGGSLALRLGASDGRNRPSLHASQGRVSGQSSAPRERFALARGRGSRGWPKVCPWP